MLELCAVFLVGVGVGVVLTVILVNNYTGPSF